MSRTKLSAVLLTVVSCLIIMLSACGGDDGKLGDVSSSEILVVYFSCTNHTEKAAQYVAEVTGGDLYEIVPAQPYTDADLDYTDGGSRSTKEQNDPSARPAIEGKVADMDGYDVVFIGYPIWHGKAPKIVCTFLESYDFTGKTIVPFCTSGGSGIAASVSELKNIASGANWLDGKRFSSSPSKSEAEDWISGLNG